jgi:hypothetical protein
VRSFGVSPADRKKDREAWLAWWAKHGATADLARLTRPGEMGRTLLLSFQGMNATVSERDRNGRVLWSIQGLQGAADAHILPGNRVLISELWGGKVTERTFDGKVLWEYKVSKPGSMGPVRCQRLANGNTFISTMSEVREVDRNGKEVFRREFRLREAWKYPDGRIALLTAGGEYQRFDPSGNVEISFPAQVQVGDALAGVDFLPNQGVLVARDGQLIEYSPDGREVWRAAAVQPYGLTRLANGHTLVALRVTREVVELDRAGQVVRRFPVTETIPWRARRR